MNSHQGEKKNLHISQIKYLKSKFDKQFIRRLASGYDVNHWCGAVATGYLHTVRFIYDLFAYLVYCIYLSEKQNKKKKRWRSAMKQTKKSVVETVNDDNITQTIFWQYFENTFPSSILQMITYKCTKCTKKVTFFDPFYNWIEDTQLHPLNSNTTIPNIDVINQTFYKTFYWTSWSEIVC